jgi:hypothetical protein
VNLEWVVAPGRWDGYDADTLTLRCVVERHVNDQGDSGWVVVAHGVGKNEEGERFQWSRGRLDQDQRLVLYPTPQAARAQAAQFVDQADAAQAAVGQPAA